MYQNYIIIKLRSLLRKYGISKILGVLFTTKDYEILFESAIINSITENDFIYDIGANRGFYTRKFLSKATQGKVFAFEPVPECYNIISELQSAYSNLIVYPIALGSTKGIFPMSIGSDDLNANSTLKTTKEENDILVKVETLDDIVLANSSIPNVLKIDVEGFELEVLKGMLSTIKNKQVCIIAIEMHFGLLEIKGYKNAPQLIVEILKTNGFKIKWIDPSHIFARRGR